MRLIAPNAYYRELTEALESGWLWGSLYTHSLADPLNVRVDTLSAGERQRLAIARTLCQRRAIVLLDEPDANLDAQGITLVAQLVRELARDHMVAMAAHTPELIRQGDIRVELIDD